jgi:hypothetical protein
MAVNLHAGAGMGPYEANMGVVAQRLFDLRQIQRVALALGSDVCMQHHREIVFGGQVINPCHCLVVGPRHITLNQRGKVVVAGEHLADTLPQARIQLEHAADMRIGVLVVGIEARQKRVKALTLFSRQLLVRMGNQPVGSAVPVNIGIVTGVVAWPLGFIFMPLFRHGYAGEHCMLNLSSSHCLQQLVHSGAFLEEIDVVQVRIAVAVITSPDADRSSPNSSAKLSRSKRNSASSSPYGQIDCRSAGPVQPPPTPRT